MSDSPTLSAIKANLAKNLAAARVSWPGEPMSQQELADRAGVSRAMVVQLESATGNPSLSKLVALAEALGVPPFLLLLGPVEMNAIAEARSSDIAEDVLRRMSSGELDHLRPDLASGVPSLRGKAISGTARSVAELGVAGGAATAAGIGTAIMPGIGTAVGAVLGAWLGSAPQRKPTDEK